ncbi:MAG: rod shape-determining protein [Methanolobus sp.]|uniref:rod shape-determining protein n=1 Tax=Methanolobus sp. TaxID=1874737 RepID=UPI002731A84A|nr:rod shape-determining protein [Methanolobus sp.]MDP2218315.1 rod shape-determining protein [Methanolobus sp.]
MATPESFQEENEAVNNFVESETNGDIIYLGIDLGTSKIAICTNDGIMFSEHSLIAHGDGHDPNVDGNDKVFFGKAALERIDLEGKWLLRDLIEKNSDGPGYLTALLGHCIQAAGVSADPGQMYAVIGVPSGADASYKRAVLGAARHLFRGVMVANGLFCVAYGSQRLDSSVIIDVGASKTDMCLIISNIPEDEDCLSISVAGENIDNELVALLAEKYEGSKVTREIARSWKEAYGFMGDTDEECKVELPLEDFSEEVIITEELRIACESIIPDIVSGIIKMVSGAEPQFRATLRNNICLCGGGSKIRNMRSFIENELKGFGGGRVFLIDDPEFSGAYGACRLAEKMPDEFWEKLNNCDN